MKAFIERQERVGREGSLPVNLGIDLGTSSTKVVWRDCHTGQASTIGFGPRELGQDRFFLPSRVGLRDGKFTWSGDHLSESPSHATTFVEHFKMCLACDGSRCGPRKCQLTDWNAFQIHLGNLDENLMVEAIAAYFLAKLLSTSKSKVSATLKAAGIKTQVHWSANLAVPVLHMDDKKTVLRFETVLLAAWLMAVVFDEHPDLCDPVEVVSLYRSAARVARSTTLDCFVYPEVAAEVASATLSRSARDGLYTFVDVGAGTVDISIFRLNTTDGETGLHIYDADVQKLGSSLIETRASERLTPSLRRNLRAIKERNPSSQESLDALAAAAEEALHEAEKIVAKDLDEAFPLLLKRAYHKEERRSAWTPMNLVLGGGGAGLAFYSDVIANVLERICDDVEKSKTLPVPDDLKMNGLPKSQFHRVAVAYGLSFEIVKLSTVALPREVEPVTYVESGRGSGREYVSKDMV